MLRLENITYSVPQANGEREKILDDITLTIDSGKYVVITGPNGGGKTTLARVIMGIVTPDSGRIKFDGMDITPLDITQRAEAGISYAFQQPPRFKGLTVRDLLQVAANKKLTRDACCDYLTKVGLCASDYLNREVDTSLSGGEVKRIEIATILAKNAPVMIFDEPEAGIDLWSFSMLIHKFEEIHKEKKQSLIVISHQEKIISMADRIMVIDDGKIKAEGLREDVLPCLNGLDKCHTCAGKAGVRA